MDTVQKHNNSECYTASSEAFRIVTLSGRDHTSTVIISSSTGVAHSVHRIQPHCLGGITPVQLSTAAQLELHIACTEYSRTVWEGSHQYSYQQLELHIACTEYSRTVWEGPHQYSYQQLELHIACTEYSHTVWEGPHQYSYQQQLNWGCT
jgi:hypothetical protein